MNLRLLHERPHGAVVLIASRIHRGAGCAHHIVPLALRLAVLVRGEWHGEGRLILRVGCLNRGLMPGEGLIRRRAGCVSLVDQVVVSRHRGLRVLLFAGFRRELGGFLANFAALVTERLVVQSLCGLRCYVAGLLGRGHVCLVGVREAFK